MPHFLAALLLSACALLAPAPTVSAQERSPPDTAQRVDFPSLDGATTLQGYLFRPDDSGAPRPAVVAMHGCSGLFNPRTGKFFALFPPWVRALTRDGYVVLVLDSASPRGVGQTCSPPDAARRMWRERPKDAYAALTFLQAQPGIARDRIALAGWSQGGGAVLTALNERNLGWASAAGRTLRSRLPHDFRAAVAFYPGACHERFQAMTMPPGETQGWTSKVPLLVLFGDADSWTQLAPCETFLDAAKARGNPIELKIYPGAVHAFDAPALKRMELPQYTTRDGRVPVIGTDPAARADAFPRVLQFLKAKLAD